MLRASEPGDEHDDRRENPDLLARFSQIGPVTDAAHREMNAEIARALAEWWELYCAAWTAGLAGERAVQGSGDLRPR